MLLGSGGTYPIEYMFKGQQRFFNSFHSILKHVSPEGLRESQSPLLDTSKVLDSLTLLLNVNEYIS